MTILLRWTQYKTPKYVQMLRATQSMVARNQMEFDRKRRNKGSQLLDELTAALRQNHAVLQAVENGRADRPEPVETRVPMGLALFNPLLGQRKIPMRRLVVPRHPTGAVPGMPTFRINRLRPYSHHIKGGSDKNKLLDNGILLRHKPGDPASE